MFSELKNTLGQPEVLPNETYVFTGKIGHVMATRHDLTDDIIEIWVHYGDKIYRWMNEDYASDSDFEVQTKETYTEQSYNVSGYDALAYADIVEKATAVVIGSEFCDDVVITLDLPEDVYAYIKQYAKDNDLTESEVVSISLEKAIAKLERDNNES